MNASGTDAKGAIVLSEAIVGQTDKDPAIAVDANGAIWAAWQSYRAGEDRIVARQLTDGVAGPLLEISPDPGINTKPAIAAVGSDMWVVWSAQRRGEWCILSRSIRSEELGPVQTLASSAALQYRPVVAVGGDGRLWVAWHAIEERRHRVRGAVLDSGAWSEPLFLSDGSGEDYRPVLCAAPGGAWLAYEKRVAAGCDLHLRHWTTEGLSAPQRFSLTESWEMAPSLASDGAGGLWAAWVASHDVRDDRGIIDHKVELMAGHFDGSGWQPYRSPDRTKPDGYVTHLYDGLLGRNHYWGFLGWRRRPQLVRQSDGDVWVLFEQKEDESRNRHGPDSLLRARVLSGKGRGRTFEISRGRYAYTVDSAWTVPGSALPYVGQTPEPEAYGAICAGQLGLDRGHPVHTRPASLWRRWQPLALPEPASPTPRPSITVDGVTYHLFWGDTHCHGSFSGDAEGEPDENYAFGRHKARLDFMAITDNDAIYDSQLTPSEWAVSRAEAAHHHEPGRFITFSGYERTAVDRLEPGDVQLRHNHRSVLFPADEGLLVRYTEPDAATLEQFVDRLADSEALVYAHHAEWRLVPSPRLVGVEVCSSWDAYLLESDCVPRALRAGNRLAFVGSSDTHRLVPGLGGALTGVWAEELSREAILAAIRARRCFATNGERLLLDVRVSGSPMGAETAGNGAVPVHCRVAAPRPIESLTLFRDGQSVATSNPATNEVVWEIEDTPGPGLHSYYLEVRLLPLPRTRMSGRGGNLQVARGDYAWSSPYWVQAH